MIKKITSAIMSAIILCTSANIVSAAAESQQPVYAYGDYEYQLTADNTVKITAYFGTDKIVSIPNSIDGKAVTALGERVFAGWFASGSAALKQLTVPDTIKTLEPYTFYNCPMLDKITLPKDLKQIPDHAFELCTGLDEIALPDGIERIGEAAFAYCESLKEIVLPKALKQLGSRAFNECKRLRKITIDDNLQTIGSELYGYHAKRFKVAVSEDNPYLSTDGRALYDSQKQTLLYYPAERRAIKAAIRDGVKRIGAHAFEGFIDLQAVTLPDGLTSIGERAFANLWNLKEVTMPDTVRKIECEAFKGCSMRQLNFPKSLKTIGEQAFYDNVLKTLNLPDGLQTVGKRAFADSLIESLYIPKSVTEIGDQAFYHCVNLHSAAIPKNTRLGKQSFGYMIGEQQDIVTADGEITVETTKKFKGFTLYCYKGSDAERYAQKNKLKFAGAADLKKARVSGVTDKRYTGTALKQAVKVRLNGKLLKRGKDYTVVYKNNVKRGKAKIYIIGKGKQTGSIVSTFKIK